jgi:hypothetical protein
MSDSATIQPLRAYLTLLWRPRRGLVLLQQHPMSLNSIIVFLIGVGFVRGMLDIPWIYWQAGRLILLLPSMTSPTWYLLNIGPFILAEIITALLRWVLFSTIVYGLGRFLGGQGSYRTTLCMYGALLGITLATILIDYLHLLMPLPLIRFSAAPRYNPVIGLGQVLTSLWIGNITYLVVRSEYQLAVWPSAMVGAFIPLLNTGLFLIVARVLFWLLPNSIPHNMLLIALNIGFVILGLSAFVALLWWGCHRLIKHDRMRLGRSLYEE